MRPKQTNINEQQIVSISCVRFSDVEVSDNLVVVITKHFRVFNIRVYLLEEKVVEKLTVEAIGATTCSAIKRCNFRVGLSANKIRIAWPATSVYVKYSTPVVNRESFYFRLKQYQSKCIFLIPSWTKFVRIFFFFFFVKKQQNLKSLKTLLKVTQIPDEVEECIKSLFLLQKHQLCF